MNDKLKSFIEYVSSHEELKAELKIALEGKEKEGQISNIVQFAKKHGHELTEEDFTLDKELSPEELEAVVGGGGCGCAALGAGDGDGLNCICAGVGIGGVYDPRHPDSQGGCLCMVGGFGTTRRH